MRELEGDAGSREARCRLIEKSARDEAFRARLLSDARGAVEEELGKRLPEGVEVRVVEETPESIYLVLPPKTAASEGGGELSERDLDVVAGGWDPGAVADSYDACGPTGSRKACDPLP